MSECGRENDVLRASRTENHTRDECGREGAMSGQRNLAVVEWQYSAVQYSAVRFLHLLGVHLHRCL